MMIQIETVLNGYIIKTSNGQHEAYVKPSLAVPVGMYVARDSGECSQIVCDLLDKESAMLKKKESDERMKKQKINS